ncbi:hypothetical protein WOLCODRAFT_163170 [Wolfiporia cocos MD-104 SS10]|uniref:Protein kinase domain-containing protein n=1 Tax=Wolfiporia cocos (strain MD-104) TaxID=742152 RepID=A0A2H3JXS2_WOLCO|nr:hypothetical protein WOLCODRAFT_163170 [Wolfiporia cocos MD-104 SS10]
MSGILKIWYLFHDGWSSPGQVEVAVDADVADLREAIGDDLGFSAVKSLSLILWKPNKKLPIEDEAKDVLAKWIREANGRFDDTVATELQPPEHVSGLIGSGVEQANNDLVHVIVLPISPEPALAEFPRAQRIRDLIGSEQKTRFYVKKLGRFDLRDLSIPENKISFPHKVGATGVTVRLSHQDELNNAPLFVQNIITSFGRKRMISDDLKSTEDYIKLCKKIGADALNHYFQSGSPPCVVERELQTYCNAVTACAPRIHHVKSRSSHYKVHHFTVHLLDPVFDEVDGTNYDKSVGVMPLLIGDGSSNSWHPYNPKNDFMLSMTESEFPLIIGESVSDVETEADRARMLLQAAVYVRVGNHFRKDDNEFVQLCIYLNKHLEAERYLVYQHSNSDEIVEGIAFLHEHNISHLDLKPTNIVVDVSTQKVYIIDFNLARQPQHEDEQISGYVGTEDWTAPEVGEHCYSPIRADRWTAGKLIQDTFKLCGSLGQELKHLDEIAIRLQDEDPRQRPALKDLLTPDEYNNWCELPLGVASFIALGCGVAGTILGMAQEWYVGQIARHIGDPVYGVFARLRSRMNARLMLCGADPGGDIGFELSFAFTAVVSPLRYIEKKFWGY